MGFDLYEKVRVKRDVKFANRSITIKAGTEGVIIDICHSLEDPNELGYTLELSEYSSFDPTFTFDEDMLEKI